MAKKSSHQNSQDVEAPEGVTLESIASVGDQMSHQSADSGASGPEPTPDAAVLGNDGPEPEAGPSEPRDVFIDVNIDPLTGAYLFERVFDDNGPVYAGRGGYTTESMAASLCDGPKKMCRRLTKDQLDKEREARGA